MKLLTCLLLTGLCSNTEPDEAIVEDVPDMSETAGSKSEIQEETVELHTQKAAGKAPPPKRERVYNEEEKKQIRQLMREREEYNRQFMPPEKRFDFNRMRRKMVPKPQMGANVADVSYEMQTIEESQEEDRRQKLRLKHMKPEELQKVHQKELEEFEAGQDANLLNESLDLANLDIVLKSHRCDACRIIANKMSIEFWKLEERFSRFSRNLSESVIYDGIEEFCHTKNWDSDGMTKALFDKDGNPLPNPVWRLVGPEFETWEARGEVTATSQLWPSRFSKHCHELAEHHDEVALYKFWKHVTKEKTDPRRSDLDDLLCFSEEDSDCNKYRNPSEMKQRPITPHILEEYEEFEEDINKKRTKQHHFERMKVLREHKRQIENAKVRIAEQEKLRKEIEKEDQEKKLAAENARKKTKKEL